MGLIVRLRVALESVQAANIFLLPCKIIEKIAVGKSYEGITLSYLTTTLSVTADDDAAFELIYGAKIEVTTVAWLDLHPKLVTAIVSKSSYPDIFSNFWRMGR